MLDGKTLYRRKGVLLLELLVNGLGGEVVQRHIVWTISAQSFRVRMLGLAHLLL